MLFIFALHVTLVVNLVAAQQKPHIIFILVDDWGWANVGYHRDPSTPEVVTPHIDQLVQEGLELDQHYTYQICSPTRCSALTGRYPIHVNDLNISPFHYNPNDPVSGFSQIPRNMTVIAEKMKEAGYATHFVGKWDVGIATPDHTPKGRGFDTSLGYFSHDNDYWDEFVDFCGNTKVKDLWENNGPANTLNETQYEEGLFRDRILDVVINHDKSTPLFLYYAPHLIHTPLQVPKHFLDQFSFIKDSDRRYYHAMVRYLDVVVDELVDALKAREMWDNLLFVLSSDNGGPVYPGGGANNYPLKGGKISDWQGGIRTNAFVVGGYLPEQMRGQKTDGYVHVADWYGTFCAIAGVDPFDVKAAKAGLPPVDSLNVWPFISGQVAVSPREEFPVSMNSLISGDYKILIGTVQQAGWTGPQYPNMTDTNGNGILTLTECGRTGCLYNIKDDPEERTNLAAQMPEKLEEMLAKLKLYQATHFNPDRGTNSPLACDAALTKYGGFFGPFVS